MVGILLTFPLLSAKQSVVLFDSGIETCSVEMEAFSKLQSLLSEAQLSPEDAIALLVRNKATPEDPQALDSSTPYAETDGEDKFSDDSSHSPPHLHADSKNDANQLETNPGMILFDCVLFVCVFVCTYILWSCFSLKTL